MTEARMVFTTIDNRERADELAKKLVELRLAACVQIIDSVRSVYWWKGGIEGAQEVLLLIKSTSGRMAELEEEISKYHSYEVPEVVAINVDRGSAKYLEWLIAACDRQKMD